MEKEQIQYFLTQNGKFLPQSEITKLSYKLQLVEDEFAEYKLLSVNFKNPTLFTLLYWLCPGFAAIDRFFIGQYLSGVFKFLYPFLWFWGMLYLTTGVIGDEILYSISFSRSFTAEDLLFYGSFVFYIVWVFADGLTMNARTKDYNLKRLLKHL